MKRLIKMIILENNSRLIQLRVFLVVVVVINVVMFLSFCCHIIDCNTSHRFGNIEFFLSFTLSSFVVDD